MACNDARARHVLEACRRIGACVPDEVAVVGVDNDELMCELAIPPLSSVVQGTDLSLKEISDRTGFSSVQYMTHVFRRLTGGTPAQYRRANRP